MNYLKAILKKDNETKIEELKKIIVLGEKLNKDTTPDKKKLEILLKRDESTSKAAKNEPKKVQEEPIEKSSAKEKDDSGIKYPIEKLYVMGNKIIIDFNVDITKDDIKFFELKQSDTTRDVFDIAGYYKDANSTKLSMNGVEKLTIGQFKPNVLRVVISDKKNPNTSVSLTNNRQAIISINDLQVDFLKEEELPNLYVDKKNSIRSITTKDNKIFVRFNKDYSKKDIKSFSKKINKTYETTFDIKGKFEHTGPTVLSIDGIDKISVNDFGNNNVRIKISNDENIKASSFFDNKELIITVDKVQSVIANSKPYPNFKAKTIVIDAGHGGDDPGAIGPNKRYEKVVVFNTAKYLYSILKQRGHKVYLTRSTDTFIKVKNRTNLANDKSADIFISIHANSVPKEKVKEIEGIETFFLSPARSERAKRAAAIENQEDIENMNSSSKSAFLESLNRPRITASHKLAIDVQAGLLQSTQTRYKDVNDSGVREGPFWVLVGAQMPSILIEVGYISHPEESRRLYEKDYQQLLANGIANGVDAYFSKNP